MKFPVLLFDLDGTLIDSEPGILECLRETLVEYGQNIPEVVVLREFIGPPIGQALAKLLGLKTEVEVKHAVTTYRKYYADHGVLNCAVFTGIRELLTALVERNYKLFIVTSKARVYAEQIAQHHQLSHFFHGIYGPELHTPQHTKAASISELLQGHQLTAAQCLMIGDRENDVTAARSHNMNVLGALWGYGSKQELADAGCMSFCEKVEDVVLMV